MHEEPRATTLKKKWEESYSSGDNNILFPQTEVIRFLNTYIAKMVSPGVVDMRIDVATGVALDFACGVGTHCSVFNEFGYRGVGVDISETAIALAKENAKSRGASETTFGVLDDSDGKLPFDDNCFDFAVAESCLDSMPRHMAKKYAAELRRVSRKYIYASFICEDDVIGNEDFIVTGKREAGTVQCVYSEQQVCELFGVDFDSFVYMVRLNKFDGLSMKKTGSRIYCVLRLS